MVRRHTIEVEYEPLGEMVKITFLHLPYRGVFQPEEAEFNGIEFKGWDQDAVKFDKIWMWADWWVEQHQAECLDAIPTAV